MAHIGMLCIVFVILVESLASGSQIVTVNSRQGKVHGIREQVDEYGYVDRFLGIPYALPPVGNLRMKPAQPPIAGFAELNATKFAPSCVQRFGNLVSYSDNKDYHKQISEDCLYLNVYVPERSDDETLPVMVWIHGGSFVVGSGAQYDGRRLAAMGQVVVVTINYRLGILGFWPNGKQENTLGLSDQIMALTWVKMAIRDYGGDKRQVTVFGQSAGAVCVSFLTTSPKTRGLFSRAIIQSGSILASWNVKPGKREENMATIHQEFIQLGCRVNDSLLCMQNATHDQIIHVTNKLAMTPPEVDHNLVVEDFKNARNIPEDVQIMMGVTTDEGRMMTYLACTRRFTQSCDEYKGLTQEELVRWELGPQLTTNEMKNLLKYYKSWYRAYPVEEGGVGLSVASKLSTDFSYHVPTNRTATNMVSAGINVRLYQFNLKSKKYRVMPSGPWSDEASHTDDIPFVFGWKNDDPEDEQAAKHVVKLWTDFAKGEPSTIWPSFSHGYGGYLFIDRSDPGGRPSYQFLPAPRSAIWEVYQNYGYFPDFPETVVVKAGARRLVVGLWVCLWAVFIGTKW